jgi:hypothetical protein
MRRLAALLAVYFSVLAIVCTANATARGFPAVARATEPGAPSCHGAALPTAPGLPAEEPAAGGSACERHCASWSAGVPFVQAATLPPVAATWAAFNSPLAARAPAARLRRSALSRHRAPPGDLVLRHASFLL